VQDHSELRPYTEHYAYFLYIVPDLTFSEMAFLQHSAQHAADSKDQKAVIRSQEKDIRRRQSMQNEISSFFKPNGEQLSEIRTSLRPDIPELHLGGECAPEPPSRKSVDPCHRSAYPTSDSQSPRFLERTSLTISRQDPTSEKIPQERFIQSEARIEGAKSMTSGRSTTYYTWLDSARSLDARGQGTLSRDNVTSESIRRSLDETRIFENTGIVRDASGRYSRCVKDLRHRNGINPASRIDLSAELSAVSEKLLASDVEMLVSKEKISKNPKNGNKADSQNDLTGSHADHRSPHPAAAISPPEHRGLEEPITGDCNPDSGYQKAVLESELESHNRCESTKNKIPRHILAQDAYVKKLLPAGATEKADRNGAQFSSATSRRAQDTATQGIGQDHEGRTRDTPKEANCPLDARVVTLESITTGEVKPHIDRTVSSGKLSSSSVVGNKSMLGIGRKPAPSIDSLSNGQAHIWSDVCDLANNRLTDATAYQAQENTRTFGCLPPRGSQAHRDIWPLPQVNIAHPELGNEPLYTRQLRNQALREFEPPFEDASPFQEGFQCYDYNLLGEDSPFRNDRGIGSGPMKDELDLRSQDALFLDPVYDGCFITEEDAQFGGPKAYYANGLAHFATHDHLDETQTTNIFDRQRWAHSHYPNFHSVQGHLGLIHDSTQEDSLMKGFWQPRRHS
jgi:hypothetical protein